MGNTMANYSVDLRKLARFTTITEFVCVNTTAVFLIHSAYSTAMPSWLKIVLSASAVLLAFTYGLSNGLIYGVRYDNNG